ncbi:hypothetical protein QTO05_00005, partial [Vibrio fortis]|uniref:hypothetical protein n=1 Tax=Vibrio fortis TaxID=212667 RepID=UPI002F412EA2
LHGLSIHFFILRRDFTSLAEVNRRQSHFELRALDGRLFIGNKRLWKKALVQITYFWGFC